ncbi:hypothetical protein E2C01_029006 [Portunus trituberculatus]|uniref:Uncharacterized protein n=1 Tax=Portunus trituberculatus TaxID=210409 RepID=A0A5B7EM77_PORTR|nr:hypothetical protein [Portunus trituberculatus]
MLIRQPQTHDFRFASAAVKIRLRSASQRCRTPGGWKILRGLERRPYATAVPRYVSPVVEFWWVCSQMCRLFGLGCFLSE